MLSQLKIKNLEMEIAAIKSRDSQQMKLKVYETLNTEISKCVSSNEFCEGVISADVIERVETDFQNNREYYYILLEFERYYMFIGLLKNYVDCETNQVIYIIDKKSNITEEDLNRMIKSSPCRYSEFKFNYPVTKSFIQPDNCDIVFSSESNYNNKLPSNVSDIERLIIKSLLKYEPEETDISESEPEYEDEESVTEDEESETEDEN